MTRLSEDEVIARLFAPMAGPAALGLRDDAGLVALAAGEELVVTTDALVAGVHFFDHDPPGAIARKALRVNLSDLAAKRSRPLGFLLAIALPPSWTTSWLEEFAAGLADDAAVHVCPLIGGDTVATPGPLTLSITAMGTVPAGRMLPRTGARPGDLVYVSGTIGDAALGLQLRLVDTGGATPAWAERLGDEQRDHLVDRYLLPRPRLGLHAALQHAHAGMDVSDGLVGDLAKMLRASGTAGHLDLFRVPLSPAAALACADDAAALTTAVTGGDDYEILCAVPPDAASAFQTDAAAAGIATACIGSVVAGSAPLVIRDARGAPVSFDRGSYSHA